MKSTTAYIRLANEEDTIVQCLESIKYIFDEILIIHSNITDRSLDLVNSYKKQDVTIKKYPHDVIPPHSQQYKTGCYKAENSLAEYYNFGLEHIKTDLLMKIDADQIYITDKLRDVVERSKVYEKESYLGCKGYNCVLSNGCIYSQKQQMLNGGADHFIIRKKDTKFVQAKYWEILSTNIHCEIQEEVYWFHFKKGHRFDDEFISGDKYPQENLLKFDENIKRKYEHYILPILIDTNSKHKGLKY